MTREDLSSRYFEWLCGIMFDGRYLKGRSYSKLFELLHSVDFEVVIGMDQNRAEDGIDLRYRFGDEQGYIQPMIASLIDNVPCSVLEMMVALSFQCENTMSDPEEGNRLSKWFWTMIDNLGLGSMDDNNYDDEFARFVIFRFLNREYSSNGEGGLFVINNCKYDLREVEIWYQMCWYLDATLNI
ncbi:hypothetical protein [Bacteroides caecimuris]|uniref:hypothetical protein n=1 Tax=Bacteroides caecimuris TaxID=1796613 RepID=UPI0026592194|nr:hypothetical protein [Bacteroides caecimuris]